MVGAVKNFHGAAAAVASPRTDAIATRQTGSELEALSDGLAKLSLFHIDVRVQSLESRYADLSTVS